MAKVEQVSAEEIAKESANMPHMQDANKSGNFSAEKKSMTKTVYISKLQISEIENFFKKFGAQTIIKYPDEKNPEWVYVECNDFEVVFNDYETVFNFFPISKADSSQKNSFDISAFSNYCEAIGIYPDQAIQNMMCIELFSERFPSYAVSRKTFDDNREKQAFNNLPKQMQKQLKTIDGLKLSENTALFNRATYGDFNIEEFIRRTYD